MLKRDAVLALRKEVWIKPNAKEDDEVEACIVPAEASALNRMLLMDDESGRRDLCERGFVDFRGFVNGNGDPVPNSLDARMELLTVSWVRNGIVEKLGQSNKDVARGEDSGGSD